VLEEGANSKLLACEALMIMNGASVQSVESPRSALVLADRQQLSVLRRSRWCFTAVINSHLAHMRIEFSCTASSMIWSVTNAGSSRSCRAMQISVARSRIKPMCVVAARISSMRRAHCSALSGVYSNGNPAIVGSGFPESCREGDKSGTRSNEPKRRTYQESLELRQLAHRGRQPF
jgi:hypothetical protein